jgi:endonuclease YncB( thermonuclease family)
MPMLAIEGRYKIIGAGPDGDSVRFYPNDPEHWRLVEGRHRVQTNSLGGAQLRLDGIDALETHYSVPHGPMVHQPSRFAKGAASSLLDWLGFTDHQRNQREIITSATPEEVPGYILTRGADKYGRCVALAGRGASPGPSGSDVFVEAELLRETANFHQLAQGMAYPTYYTKLYAELRQEMTQAATRARRAGDGLWPHDVTRTGAKIDSMDALTEAHVMLPKLFRRLANYIVLNNGSTNLHGFEAFLKQGGDRLLILSEAKFTGFNTVVQITNTNTVRMSHDPEDLVFEEG